VKWNPPSPLGDGAGFKATLTGLMGLDPLRKKVVITNRAGLHARPIFKFVEIANRYPNASIQVGCNGQTVDGKSTLQLMTLAAAFGTELELISQGEDSQALIESLSALIAAGFDENDPAPAPASDRQTGPEDGPSAPGSSSPQPA
jgi:phosphocarrier protein HPr